MRPLVLDANIFIRAALGKRVLALLDEYAPTVPFFAPDTAFDEARKHLPALSAKHGLSLELPSEAFQAAEDVVERIPAADYGAFEEAAMRRIASRDPDDWPVLATALLLKAPIWTEDRDFFGTGVATWTTSNVEVYLRGED